MLPNAITHARLPSPYRKHAPRRGSARNCQCVVADGNRRDRRRKCLIAGTVAKTQTKLRGSCERTSSGPVSTDASKDPISGVHAARVIASGPVSHRLECLARRMRSRFWLLPADGVYFPISELARLRCIPGAGAHREHSSNVGDPGAPTHHDCSRWAGITDHFARNTHLSEEHPPIGVHRVPRAEPGITRASTDTEMKLLQFQRRPARSVRSARAGSKRTGYATTHL